MKLLLLLLTPAMAKDFFGLLKESGLMYCKNLKLANLDECKNTGLDAGTYRVR